MKIDTGIREALNDGTIQGKYHIGWVVGVKYNSEGNILDWLCKKTGEWCDLNNNYYVFPSEKSVIKIRDFWESKGAKSFYRKFYYWENINDLG